MILFFRQSPPNQSLSPPTAYPNCSLAYSLEGRDVREGESEKPAEGMPRKYRIPRSFPLLLPRSWAHPCTTDTAQTSSDPYRRTNESFQNDSVFPETFYQPSQSKILCLLFHYLTMGRDRLVFMEQHLSLQEHP